ncbi:MAG: hypothetical protein A2Z72_03050 [Omnitrophica bacterium RBG_13_46_9]|nr:MAG: hypothetical protein A2Z72_03050 [Omnitrophica bacterium RBG_13_46_9]
MKKMIVLFAFILPVCTFIYFIYPNIYTNKVEMSEEGNLWTGVWASAKTGVKGDFQATLQKEGTNLLGNIKIGGSSITKGGSITGTVNGDKIEFGLAKDKRGRLKYAGQIKGDTMSGTWEIPIIKDRGTWEASKN